MFLCHYIADHSTDNRSSFRFSQGRFFRGIKGNKGDRSFLGVGNILKVLTLSSQDKTSVPSIHPVSLPELEVTIELCGDLNNKLKGA